MQGITPIAPTRRAFARDLDRDQAVRGGSWWRVRAGGTLLKGAAIPQGASLQEVKFVAGSVLVLWTQILLTTLLWIQQVTKQKNHFQQVWHVSLSLSNPSALIRMGGEQTAHTSAKRRPKYPECQLQQSRSFMQDWKYVGREKVSIKFCYISMNCYLGNWRKLDIIK